MDQKDNINRGPNSAVTNTQKGHTSVRVLGVFILLIEFGLLFAYGFSSSLINEFGSWGGKTAVDNNTINLGLYYEAGGFYFYMSTMIFALIAFGCLFALISRSTLSGFFTSFFIVGFTTIFSPLLQKFWYNVFTYTFAPGQGVITGDPLGLKDYNHYLSSSTVLISFYDMRISLLNVISQLVVFYGVYQKMNVAQTFLFSLFFQCAWTLNFALCAQVSSNQPDSLRRLFDDYAISQVFLFGSVFGLLIAFLNKRPPRDDYSLGVGLPRHLNKYSEARGSQVPLIVSLVGTFLLFITFMGITLCFPVKSARNRFFWPQAYMNILFALSASVFVTMFLGTLVRGKLPLKEIHFGIIGGAIIAGPIAGTLDNIGSFMALGAFAAIINIFYFGYLDRKMNKHHITDTYGAGYIAIVSLLGTIFIAPLTIVGMVNNSVNSNSLSNVILTDKQNGAFVIAYVGISVGIALVGGVVVGLLVKCLGRQVIRELDDENIFVPYPGLYDDAYARNRSRIEQNNFSATQLRGNQPV